MTEKKGSEKREFCSFRFQIRARFVFAIIPKIQKGLRDTHVSLTFLASYICRPSQLQHQTKNMTMAATTTRAQPFSMQLSIFLSHSEAGALWGATCWPFCGTCC